MRTRGATATRAIGPPPRRASAAQQRGAARERNRSSSRCELGEQPRPGPLARPRGGPALRSSAVRPVSAIQSSSRCELGEQPRPGPLARPRGGPALRSSAVRPVSAIQSSSRCELGAATPRPGHWPAPAEGRRLAPPPRRRSAIALQSRGARRERKKPIKASAGFRARGSSRRWRCPFPSASPGSPTGAPHAAGSGHTSACRARRRCAPCGAASGGGHRRDRR